MDVEMDATFAGVIDPSLASPEAFPASPLSPTPQDGDTVAVDLDAPPASSSEPKRKKRGPSNGKAKEKAPKAKKAAPGSAADFRRREANRLAAERSRSRASEKAVALENARKSLAEENQSLKEQIAQLEDGFAPLTVTDEATATVQPPIQAPETGRDHDDHPLFGNETQSNSSPAEQVHVTLDDHTSHHGHGQHDDHDHAQRQEQEAHSHTILAALTDITGVDFSESNDASWMQGMESFLKESDTSGRLGELAAVASGTNGDRESVHEQTAENSQMDPQHLSTSRPAVPVDAGLQLAEERRFKMPVPAGPINNAVTVLAAAINTEMERLIMEDLADTKAAIVQIEKQIAALREGRDLPADGADHDPSSSLPSSILRTDSSSLSASVQEVQTNIAQVQSDLPGLHEELGKLRDEKTTEVDQVTNLMKELKTTTIEDEDEMQSFIGTLKAVGGLVESLLSDEKPQPDLSYASGTYSSPAIARRRRGRPPKGDNPRTFYQSFLLSPSSSSTRTEHAVAREPKVKAQPKPKKPKAKLRERLAARPRRSRLGQHVVLPETEEDVQEKNVQEDLRQLQAHAQAEAQERENGEIDGVIDPRLTDEVGNQADHTLVEGTPGQGIPTAEGVVVEHQPGDDASVDAVNRAEAFILSQLDSQTEHVGGHDESDHRDHHIPPLDSTSFADFLPAQEELERQAGAGQDQGQGQGQFSHNPSLSMTSLPTSRSQGPSHQDQLLGQAGEDSGAGSQSLSESSVLARLKKGPPGSCDICMRTETTVWRKLSLGTQDLKVCNACGTYHHKFGVIRPPELWNDGKSIRRRRTNPRPSAAQTEGEEGETSSPRPRKRAKKVKRAHDQSNAEDPVQSQSPTHDHEQDHAVIGAEAENETHGPQELSEEGRRAVLDAALIQGLDAIGHEAGSMVQDDGAAGDETAVDGLEHGQDEGLREVVQAVQAARRAMAESVSETGGDEVTPQIGEDATDNAPGGTGNGQDGLLNHDEEGPHHHDPEGDMASVFAI
ncbi:hypothetical protein IAU59_007404 [Kwoniella sp. CBS 9459]